MNFKDLESTEFQKYINEKVEEQVQKKLRPAHEIILDDNDLQTLLKISRRTSLEWRQRGYLRSYKMGDGKIYYFLGEIIEDIKGSV